MNHVDAADEEFKTAMKRFMEDRQGGMLPLHTETEDEHSLVDIMMCLFMSQAVDADGLRMEWMPPDRIMTLIARALLIYKNDGYDALRAFCTNRAVIVNDKPPFWDPLA